MELEKINYIQQLEKALPLVFKLMNSPLKNMTLKEYVLNYTDSLYHRKRSKPIQDSDDFLTLIATETETLYGKNTANTVLEELENRFAMHTANHQGIDFHYEFFQGDLIFALGSKKVVPLLSCGGVPCDNICFPRGIALSSRKTDTTKARRVPILSNAERKIFVSIKHAYKKEQIKISPDRHLHNLSNHEAKLLHEIVQDIFLNSNILKQKSFSSQMSIANSLMWEKLTPNEFKLPSLVCLELRKICKQLLITDIQNSQSLIQTILFEPQFTASIFDELNFERACWQITDTVEKGSFLFWAIDENHNSHRLSYDKENHCLFNPLNQKQSFKLTPQSITAALQENRLLPTLYMCFCVLAMARGLTCFGGPYQHHYLTAMEKGTKTVLAKIGENAMADKIQCITPFITGLMPLKIQPLSSEQTFFAGLTDVLIAGGIDENFWNKLKSINVYECFKASFPFHYEEVIAASERLPHWAEVLKYPSPLIINEI